MRYLIFCLTTLFAAQAFAQPGYFRVSGVASDDTLNVRAEPRASSADIGDLAFNARGIEVSGLDASGKWGRIVWQEGNGWVAMRFMVPDAMLNIGGTNLPAGLICAGTEPFWSLELNQASAAYSDISGAGFWMPLNGARVAEGRPNFPVQLGHSGGGASTTTLIRPAACSDGMSERIYPWTVDLLMTVGGTGRYMTGCCHLPH